MDYDIFKEDIGICNSLTNHQENKELLWFGPVLQGKRSVGCHDAEEYSFAR